MISNEEYTNPFLFAEHQLLEACKGIIHVGAGLGEERFLYQQLGKMTLWIEAIPEVALKLANNIAGMENMTSLQALLWSQANETKKFHIANRSDSSSILEFNQTDLTHGLRMERAIELNTSTLDSVLLRSPQSFPKERLHLVIDTQGTELEVLKGSSATLSKSSSLKVEVSNFYVYEGGALVEEIDEFLEGFGFTRITACPGEFHGDAIYVRFGGRD